MMTFMHNLSKHVCAHTHTHVKAWEQEFILGDRETHGRPI